MNPLFTNTVIGEDPNALAPFITYDEINQKYSTTCAIRSQQIILRDYGIDIPQEELMNLAKDSNWWIEEAGTPRDSIGYILQSQGIDCHQASGCSVYDLMDELSKGHRVIVSVDSGELWAARNHDFGAAIDEQMEDLLEGETADHALIVAGIKVNPENPSEVSVIITDPGTGDLRLEYPLNEFLDAWQDSNCFMCATDTPAPFQYDENLHAMVPSNFVCDYDVSYTSFPMPAEDIFTPLGYVPYYDQHLDVIGWDVFGNPVTYDQFQNIYLDFSGDIVSLEESMNNLYGFTDELAVPLPHCDDFAVAVPELALVPEPDFGLGFDIEGGELDSLGSFHGYDPDMV